MLHHWELQKNWIPKLSTFITMLEKEYARIIKQIHIWAFIGMADCLKPDLRIAADFVNQSLVAPKDHHGIGSNFANIFLCLIWGIFPPRAPPSLWMTLFTCPCFQVYQIAPDLEACHAIAQRLRAELVPVVHVTPDKHEQKWKYAQIKILAHIQIQIHSRLQRFAQR